jgi:hypothetical protein
MDSNLGKRLLSIKARKAELTEAKNKLLGQLQTEKKNLAKIVEEIKAKGYEPDLQKLKEVKQKKEKEFSDLVDSTEAELAEVEEKLSKIQLN